MPPRPSKLGHVVRLSRRNWLRPASAWTCSVWSLPWPASRHWSMGSVRRAPPAGPTKRWRSPSSSACCFSSRLLSRRYGQATRCWTCGCSAIPPSPWPMSSCGPFRRSCSPPSSCCRSSFNRSKATHHSNPVSTSFCRGWRRQLPRPSLAGSTIGSARASWPLSASPSSRLGRLASRG